MTLTVTDLFCGAGGSSQGAEEAGGRLALGLNHWRRAIDTHATNFPHAEHDCADVSACDPRYYPTTDLLLSSPECTAHSYANGVSRKLARRSLFERPDPAAERSRATMWDVVRFMEAHRYQAVIVENVVNVRDWELFEPWLHAVRSVRPGYQAETVYLNSMVCWPTPQSRDRLYTLIWRKGAPRPRLRFDAPAWCPTCQTIVAAVQSWKNPRRPWGRYAQQYWYRCPVCAQIAWPLVYPAATAIDWSLDAPRIGDRPKPLAANTLARIQAGLRRYAAQPTPVLVRVAGHTFQRDGSTCRVRPTGEPFPVQTGTLADALVVPVNGHVADAGGTGRRARDVAEPLATLTADKALALIVSARGTDRNDADHRVRHVREPLPTQGASKTMALLVTAGGSWADSRPVSDPAPTQTAREAWGLLVPTEARDGLRARPAGEPMRTQTTRAELGLAVLPFITELYGTARDGRPVSDPLGTVTALGDHHYLAVTRTAGCAAWSTRPARSPPGTITPCWCPTTAPAARGGPPSRCARSPPTTGRRWSTSPSGWTTAGSGCCSPARSRRRWPSERGTSSWGTSARRSRSSATPSRRRSWSCSCGASWSRSHERAADLGRGHHAGAHLDPAMGDARGHQRETPRDAQLDHHVPGAAGDPRRQDVPDRGARPVRARPGVRPLPVLRRAPSRRGPRASPGRAPLLDR